MKRVSTKEHWNLLWKKSNLFYNQKIVEIISKKFKIKNLKILEVGAGSGTTSLFLASLGADVTTLDYSEEAIKLIKKNNIYNIKINIIQGDAFKLPLKDNTFDVVFSQGLLEHFRNPDDILLEKKRVVKEGGYILIDVPQKYNFYTLRKNILILLNKWFAGWERSFSKNELSELILKNGLKIENFYAYAHIRNLGRIQQKILKKEIIPHWFTSLYNNFWKFVEKSPIAVYTLFSIIVMAKKEK